MKKKVLLMGKNGSGKTSMRSIIFANYVARDTRRLGATIDVEHSHVRFLGNLFLNLWDCGGQEAFMENYFASQRDNIFKNVEVLIYVFDVESRELEKDMHYYQSCLEAILQNSPEAKVFCLIHKMDLIQEDQRDSLFAMREDELKRCSLPLQCRCFRTSIWDETLYKAWSAIVYQLIPNVRQLEMNVKAFADIIEADEVLLFEKATFLVISHCERKPHKDVHRFEKVSNIIKQFKLSCSKLAAQFQRMEVRNSKFAAFIEYFTSNTFIMVVMSDTTIPPAATWLNIKNARRCQKDSRKAFFLQRDVTVIVGRGSSADLVVKASYVSRVHCELRVDTGGNVRVFDAKSASGTFVNGRAAVEKGKEVEVSNGDWIAFGNPDDKFVLENRKCRVMVCKCDKETKARINRVLECLGCVRTQQQFDAREPPDYSVFPESSISTRFICALVYNSQVVTPDYFLGLAGMKAGMLPDPDAFRPPPEDKLKAAAVPSVFGVDLKRSKLFAGRLFVFGSRFTMDNVGIAVEGAGGKSCTYDQGTHRHFDSNTVYVLPVETPDAPIPSHIHCKRGIDVREIALAIIFTTTEVFTNPDLECDIENYQDYVIALNHPTQILPGFTQSVDSAANTVPNPPSSLRPVSLDANDDLFAPTSKRQRSLDADDDLFSERKSLRSAVSLDGDEDLFGDDSKDTEQPKRRRIEEADAEEGEKRVQEVLVKRNVPLKSCADEFVKPATEALRKPLGDITKPAAILKPLKRKDASRVIEESHGMLKPLTRKQELVTENNHSTQLTAKNLTKATEMKFQPPVEESTPLQRTEEHESEMISEETPSVKQESCLNDTWLNRTMLRLTLDDSKLNCVETRDLTRVETPAQETVSVRLDSNASVCDDRRFRKQLHFVAHPSEIVSGETLTSFNTQNSFLAPDEVDEVSAVFSRMDRIEESRENVSEKNRFGGKAKGTRFDDDVSVKSKFGKRTASRVEPEVSSLRSVTQGSSGSFTRSSSRPVKRSRFD
ncbi:unnamed protein product [Notodromas monacha]|uniref:FHA domain-containing protein n=1 Tax=Notodromas monacha TaxID=399045 RepID=A0A7R9BSE8_9CRUS|nr:unnamed protein product [Notodromas monacha]CAG0920843.1 unnamed protein product [Notodromas monacha]